MAWSDEDRVQVARVRIQTVNGEQEIERCLISVTPGRNRLGIWLSPDAREPSFLVSLDEVLIDWRDVELPPMLA